MLAQEEHAEISAPGNRGWSFSAIARHLRVSRNTVKTHLRGGRSPDGRQPAGPDRFEPYLEYLGIRLRNARGQARRRAFAYPSSASQTDRSAATAAI
jgi:IS30 family transposase